jgi:signal transduction histidine kinase
MSSPSRTGIESLRTIYSSTDGLLRDLALEDSLQGLLSRTREVFTADLAAILLPQDDDYFQCLCCSAPTGSPTAFRLKAKSPIIVRVLAARARPAVLDEEGDLAEFTTALSLCCASLLGAMLPGDDTPLGLVFLGQCQARRFNEEEQGLFQLVSDRAATVVLHARLFEQVRAGRARAQVLSQQLMEAQEAERRRLARELHDEVGQALTAIKMNLQATRPLVADPTVQTRLDEGVTIVEAAIQQVRNLSLDLRPSILDDLGLVAAVRWYLDRQAQRVGYVAEFAAVPPTIRASPNLETICFRVVQEALTNIARHAQARRVQIELRRPRTELELLIRDDGVGFDVEAARQRAARGSSLGLLGMQERVLLSGGRFEIVSAPGQGTEIRARFPLSPQPAVERRSRMRTPLR